MIYEVSEKDGETARIKLQQSGETTYELTVDGERIHVDAVTSGRTIYSIIEDGKQFEVLVDERGAHGFDVLVSGRLFHLEAVDERSKLLAQTAEVTASGPQRVEAEMPGKVVDVHLAVGDPVRSGQGVVVVEAMKMENEIPAPKNGRVSGIRVKTGDSVEAGALLVNVE